MKRIIDLEKFIRALKNKKYNNKIQLEVEGKFLKTANQLIIKKLVVSEKLLNYLGMEKRMIDGPTTKNPPKPTLRELVENGFNKVNHRLGIIEKDVSILKTDVSSLKTDMKLIKSLPTIQKEIKELENKKLDFLHKSRLKNNKT